jgi:hypothetical protein
MADEHDVSRASLTLAYEGPAVRDGFMEVRDLAPALLGLQEIFDAANRICNGERTHVSIVIGTPSKPASFPIDFVVVASILDAARQMLGMVNLKGAKELAEVVFGKEGVIGLFRFLKERGAGKVQKIQDLKDGTVLVSVVGDNNVVLTMPAAKEVLALADDAIAQHGVQRMAQPLRTPGVERLETREGGARRALVEASDLSALTSLALREDLGDVITASERETVVTVTRPNFEPHRRWGLRVGRSSSFGAEVLDQEFLDQVERHQLTFGKGDSLRVLLRERITLDGEGKPQAHHQVLKVLQVLPAVVDQQRRLFPSSTEGEER